MTAIHPPRGAEAILESFGADPELTDAILGDLSQEYSHRVERFGPRAARWWYYRQALLTAPALLRNWLKGAGWADARRLLNVVALSYVITLMIQTALFFGVSAIVMTLLPKTAFAPFISSWLAIVALAAPFCSGYLAATFEESRPMIATLAQSFVGLAVQVLGAILLFTRPDVNVSLVIVMRMAIVPLLMLTCIAGGALRVRNVSVLRAAAASSTPS